MTDCGGAAQEVALIGMLGYLSYLAGELAGLSGIVTLFCCAVAISHYALHNVSAPARVTLVRPPRRRSFLRPRCAPCPCKRMAPSVCCLLACAPSLMGYRGCLGQACGAWAAAMRVLQQGALQHQGSARAPPEARAPEPGTPRRGRCARRRR